MRKNEDSKDLNSLHMEMVVCAKLFIYIVVKRPCFLVVVSNNYNSPWSNSGGTT